jgi:hypothetical protein
MQLDESDRTFLMRFTRSPDGQVLQRLLRAERTRYDTRLRGARGEDIFRAQGAANAIDELIVELERAAKPATPPVSSRRPPRVVDSEPELGA